MYDPCIGAQSFYRATTLTFIRFEMLKSKFVMMLRLCLVLEDYLFCPFLFGSFNLNFPLRMKIIFQCF